MNTCTFTR